MVRRCVWSRNLVNEETLAHWGGGCCAKKSAVLKQILYKLSLIAHKTLTLVFVLEFY